MGSGAEPQRGAGRSPAKKKWLTFSSQPVAAAAMAATAMAETAMAETAKEAVARAAAREATAMVAVARAVAATVEQGGEAGSEGGGGDGQIKLVMGMGSCSACWYAERSCRKAIH